MTDELSRRGFLRSLSAAALANAFAGKIAAQQAAGKPINQPEFDFRCIRWGMSQDEVVVAEDTEAFFRMPSTVMYRHSIDQLPLTLCYRFALQDGEAVCVAATLQTDLAVNCFYVAADAQGKIDSRLDEVRYDYTRVKQVLTGEYGDPVVEDSPYQNEELVSDLLAHGESARSEKLSYGDPTCDERMAQLHSLSHSEETIRSLMIEATWKTPRTKISLRLIPVACGGVMLIVGHFSSAHSHLLKHPPSGSV